MGIILIWYSSDMAVASFHVGLSLDLQSPNNNMVIYYYYEKLGLNLGFFPTSSYILTHIF